MTRTAVGGIHAAVAHSRLDLTISQLPLRILAFIIRNICVLDDATSIHFHGAGGERLSFGAVMRDIDGRDAQPAL